MIKKLIAGAFICLIGITYAQTDQLNTKKYWKFRNNFRRDFVKIGPARGEGIPIASRLPIGCANNIDATGNKGLVRWADGMIFQGHYIGFLATEYRLLKNRGKDVTATLNELYYALNAINRVDLGAEKIISEIDENGLPVGKSESLNGFYLRDDADDETYKNWENGKINCRCGEGSAYRKNNMAGLNSGGNIARAKSNDHSTPSLDQMTSLLVGIVMINKLLDDGVYVQPTPEDAVMDIKTEAKAIANRLISYGYNHNWFLLDEWGWPVGNGGGDLFFTAYPLSLIGNQITGNIYTLNKPKRYKFQWDFERKYHSQTLAGRELQYDAMSWGEKNKVDKFYDWNEWAYQPFQGIALSNFEIFQKFGEPGGIIGHEFEVDFLDSMWINFVPDRFLEFADDWADDSTFNDTFTWPLGTDKHGWNIFSDYNKTIAFNLGVASGLFDSSQVSDWSFATNNYQMALIHAVINESTPAYGSKAFFQTFLNSMPVYGGFKFHGQEWLGYDHLGNDSVGPNQVIWSPGWGGEYKWNDPLESNSEIGHQGQFNALDYMYLHNLYYLVYGDDISDPYEESYDCFCGSVGLDDIIALQADNDNDLPLVEMDVNNAISSDAELHSKIIQQMGILDFCSSNVFAGPTTTSVKNIKQLFDDYHDIGISLNEFQTETHTVSDGGEVNIESRLIVCNTKELKVLVGGEINLDKGEILIKPGASLVIEGNVHIARGARIIVESEGKIVIKNGGNLDNSGYIQLQDGATFEYEDGATFQMNDDFAELHIDGGDIIIRENANFIVEKSGTQSGQLRFSEWGYHIIAEDNTSFMLKGNGETDPILVLDEDADFWSDSDGLKWIALVEGRVVLNENTRVVALQQFTANDVHFDGLAENRGLVAFNKTNISGSVFDEAPIYAPLFYKNAGDFIMTTSEVNNVNSEIALKIKGMGYNISHTDFNGSGYYLLSGQNTTHFSRVTECTFNGSPTTVGIIDNSNAEIEINKNNFNSLYVGLHKLDGRANVKCNNFNDFKYAGVVAHNNCVLDMSTNGLGGYNVFDKNDAAFGTNIALWETQSALLSNGKNSFDDSGTLPIIKGSLQITPPVGLVPVISAHSNKWNPANTEPAAYRFNVISSTGSAVSVLTGSPNSATCPNTAVYVSGSVFNVPGLTGTLPVLQTLHFDNIGLADALDICINATEQFGGTSDLTALELFEEVLVTYPSMPSSQRTDWLVRFGSQKMKNTLQRLITDGEIVPSDNTTQFGQEVQRYVNVLNALTSVNVNTANYKQMFYWEMDKVHLFHILGKRNLAVLTLLNTESCGLDSIEQAYVNHWKIQLDEEVKKIYFGYTAEFIDTTWIDTTQYTVPSQQSFGNFGSTIQSATTIEFYNCENYRTQIKTNESENSIDFSVYPNPNQGLFSIYYSLPEESSGEVIVYSADGKQIHSFLCQSGEHRQIVDVTGVAKGTYLYTFIIDGEGVSQGKFIVQ